MIYDDVQVLCPFFTSRSKHSIVCEGITDECSTIIKFSSIGKRQEHKRIFCDCKYTYCEVYKMLEKKYE